MAEERESGAELQRADPTPGEVLEAIDALPIVCVAASTGGLAALQAFYCALPADTGATFVTITPSLDDFRGVVSERIARLTGMRTVQVASDTVLAANTVHFVPPDDVAVLEGSRLTVRARDARAGNGSLVIDAFLESVAASAGARATAVILAGTGTDGSRGVRALKAAGSVVVTQDPELARFDEMPRGAIETGVVAATGDPTRLAHLVVDMLQRGSRDVRRDLASSLREMSDLRVELARVREALRVATGDRWHIDPDREDLLDGAGIGTLFLDTELRIRRLNPAVTRVLQLAAHDVGRSIEEFAHDLGAEFLDDVRSALREARTVERDVRSANGTWLRVTHRPTSDPAKARTGVVVTLADVTPLRNAHEMTRMANEQLEAANQELARRQDELEELFSIVAHDLKRPLIAMDGLLSLVPDRIAASNTDEAAALTARARHECDRMKRMLDDLARVSALSREDVVMEDVDLRVWLEGIVGQVREIAAQRGVRFTCSSDAGHVRLPANALEQSAVNLLENALNYGCTGEKPRIDVSCRLQPGRVELSVRDNGKGIAPSDHQKVFEPFRRLDPDLAAGSGVGLMAVRRLVTRASGTVTLQSDRGRGANFTVRVPATFDAEQAAAVAPRPRVLVVEDDALDAKVIARYLGEDFVVTRAEDLARASACLERDTFDLVLLDLSLPDGHGFLLVNDVRAKLPKGTPIVVITGHGGGIALDSISATIAGVVAKEALTKETLRSAIADALEPARAHG